MNMTHTVTNRFFTKYLLTRFAALLMGLQSHSALAQRGPASVFVDTVAERNFVTKIEALGTLEPKESVDLTLNVADRVQSLYFDDGQRVKRGKTLLSLAQREQIALTEAAEANADEARRQLDRIERLVDRKAVSQAELDEARRNLDAANAQLRAVQSRQKDRVLVAPFNGLLGFRQVSVGSFIRPGDVVARLVDDSQMRLEFTVPSTFLRAIQPGTPIIATTDDLPGETFAGDVTTLDNAIDPITRSVRVRATLPNPDQILVTGMFMEIALKASPRQSLAIPQEAIQPVGPKTFVFIVDETEETPTAKRVEITVGDLQDGFIEVLDGLDFGAKVITEGVIRVREGSAVKIEEKSILLPNNVGNTGEQNERGVSSGAATISRGG